MSVIWRTAGVLAVVLAATAGAAAQGVLTERNVSLAMAKTIAEGAIEECTKGGHRVTVAVLDRAGQVKVTLRGDGAPSRNLEGAQRKAYTALTFRAPSAEVITRVEKNPELAAFREYTGVLLLGGGLPIKVGDDIIGAVGVSGAPSGRDEPCAKAGIDRVADQLR
jgi:uncharacterized protein GlcG (DUF336 family)